MYGKYGSNIVQKHEKVRREFRGFCKNQLRLSTDTLDGLIRYMKKIRDKIVTPDKYFIDVVENEFRMSELFQLKVLDMDFMTTMHPRYKWSFKNYLKCGDGWADKEYTGTILRYDAGNFA
jgi:hypothetical protein